ncbi:MAG: response regulator [Leptospiraceae bacterium]|nr:response regulator [Leptospiraceae bacterium]
MNNRIIITDDDPSILKTIEKILSKENYIVEAYKNPKQALEAFRENPSLVFISDLHMPEMTGIQLSHELLCHPEKPVIIILTSETDLGVVIKLMREGIYDYLVKGFQVEELTGRVSSAFEIAEFRKIQKTLDKEREIRIESQLNWNLWKETLIKKDTDKTEANLIGNLNHSLIQGAGIGLTTSLIGMVKEGTKPNDDSTYIVDKEILDMLFDNADSAKELTMMLGEIDYVINNVLPLKKESPKFLEGFLNQISNELKPLAELKNQSIKIGTNAGLSLSNVSLAINEEYLKHAFQEILINAFKFSLKDSSIYVLTEVHKQTLNLNFLSAPEAQLDILGIREEYQNLIFEPFFRIARTVQEHYGTLDFGLGLCNVQKIVHRHSAKIRAYNLKNYLDNTSPILVCFTVEFPLI